MCARARARVLLTLPRCWHEAHPTGICHKDHLRSGLGGCISRPASISTYSYGLRWSHLAGCQNGISQDQNPRMPVPLHAGAYSANSPTAYKTMLINIFQICRQLMSSPLLPQEHTEAVFQATVRQAVVGDPVLNNFTPTCWLVGHWTVREDQRRLRGLAL